MVTSDTCDIYSLSLVRVVDLVGRMDFVYLACFYYLLIYITVASQLAQW